MIARGFLSPYSKEIRMPFRKTLWYKDAIIYELHVKAFYDKSGDGVGDFKGLMEKLDYLQDLGITAVWLLPFYPSPLKDDGYDIADYRGIHSIYGNLRDFRQFVKEAHRRDIRVITELVVNHTSDQHPWFQEARRAKPGSAKRNFYLWSDTDSRFPETRIIFTDTETSNWAWDPVAGAYYWHRFFSHQPDLNHNNPKVVQAILKVLAFWLKMGVDGLRLDAVPYLCVRDGTNNENLPETHEVIRKIRKYVDDHFKDRMLLAEANQWPEDVVEYFGKGDECHMAYHFPVMPRLYMALRQEDRTPIVEILKRTPPIPGECQWALFLRNHDELTLEMVTDEERDYMYNEYARDPRMRVNVGIRRRLAPLVENSLRRRELLHSLLFSFPGTPIIYYGDEIGMGDNIYLGDRDGVRTPMQWSTDRNAGFSRADAAKLYLPVITDPVYGYQGVNVEAQQRHFTSFYHFMRRMIALRKQHKAFGRGTMEFLEPENHRVLAYLRRYKEEVILAVANLSRFVQPVELDLSRFRGWTPVEMLGRVEFPTIGDLPYFLTLGPHAFYWFRLEPQAEPMVVGTPAQGEELTTPVLSLDRKTTNIYETNERYRLEGEMLPSFIRKQRYFRGKGRDIVGCRMVDWTKLGNGFHMTFVQVSYGDGGKELYVLPLKMSWGLEASRIVENVPESVLVFVKTSREKGAIYDALVDKTACHDLLMALYDERYFATYQEGRVSAHTTRDTGEDQEETQEVFTFRRLSAEQSNTSLVINDNHILKIFRKLEEGINPDMEITLALTEHTSFSHVPRAAGYMVYDPKGGARSTVALLQKFIPNEGDGWAHAQKCLSDYFQEADRLRNASPVLPGRPGKLLERVATGTPEIMVQLAGDYLQAVERLGQRTAEFHMALSSIRKVKGFAPERITPDYLEVLSDGFSSQARRSLELINAGMDHFPEEVQRNAHQLLERAASVMGIFQSLPEHAIVSTKIRVHGDFHLGQVLRVHDDFYFLDFEGEPMRSLQERREKHSPLKDIAGMLRSFDYAAHTALFIQSGDREERFEQFKPWARAWELWVSKTFLQSYLGAMGNAPCLPRDSQHLEILLNAFLLDKAFYELEYEINNRPAWVQIPLQGILGLLGEGSERNR